MNIMNGEWLSIRAAHEHDVVMRKFAELEQFANTNVTWILIDSFWLIKAIRHRQSIFQK